MGIELVHKEGLASGGAPRKDLESRSEVVMATQVAHGTNREKFCYSTFHLTLKDSSRLQTLKIPTILCKSCSLEPIATLSTQWELGL